MSRSLFGVMAAAVTLGGWFAVVCVARFIRHRIPSRTKLLAGFLLVSYGIAIILRPSAWPAIDLAVLTGAVGGVLLLETALATPGAVATFLGVAAVVDILSMYQGPSRLLIERYREGTSDLLLYLTLVVPVRGHAAPVVGIGDLFIGGAAATALLRVGFRPVTVMGTVAIGLLSALAYGLWRGSTPAIPFIAIAMFLLMVIRKHTRLPAVEGQ